MKINRSSVRMNKQSSLVRTEILNKKEYFVLPVVALLEGVHNGLFYSAEEISKFPQSWNGSTIPVHHPHDENGIPVSANSPEIEKDNVGTVFNTIFEEGKLKTELWLEKDALATASPNSMSMIKNGDHIEVSTGLFNEHIEESGEWNGEEFFGRVVNFRPDHIALLPDEIGACSWEDGCGGPRINTTVNIRGTARTPIYKDKETTSWGSVVKTFSAYRDGYYKEKGNRPGSPEDIPKSVSDAPGPMKTWIASKSLLGEVRANGLHDLIFFPVVNPDTGKLNEGALQAVLGGRGSQADIPIASLASAQSKARALLKKEFTDEEATTNTDGGELMEDNLEKDVLDGEEGSTPSRSALRKVITKVAEVLGMRTNEISHSDIRAQLNISVRAEHSGDNEFTWVRDVFNDYFVYEHETSDPVSMRLLKRSYTKDVNDIVSLGDDATEVKEEVKFVPVVNEENSEGEENTSMQTPGEDVKLAVEALIVNEAAPYDESDREYLLGLTMCKLGKLNEPYVKANTEGVDTDQTENTSEGQDTQDAGGSPDANSRAGGEADKGTPAVLTEEKVVELIGKAIKTFKEDDEKTPLVTALLANKECEVEKEDLEKMSIGGLKSLAKTFSVSDFSGRGAVRGHNIQASKVVPLTATPVVLAEKKEASA